MGLEFSYNGKTVQNKNIVTTPFKCFNSVKKNFFCHFFKTAFLFCTRRFTMN